VGKGDKNENEETDKVFMYFIFHYLWHHRPIQRDELRKKIFSFYITDNELES